MDWEAAYSHLEELWKAIRDQCVEFEPSVEDRFRFLYELRNYPPRISLNFEPLPTRDKRLAEDFGSSEDRAVGATSFRRSLPETWLIEIADFVARLSEIFDLKPRRCRTTYYELRPDFGQFQAIDRSPSES